jgi:hypothetical protein
LVTKLNYSDDSRGPSSGRFPAIMDRQDKYTQSNEKGDLSVIMALVRQKKWLIDEHHDLLYSLYFYPGWEIDNGEHQITVVLMGARS